MTPLPPARRPTCPRGVAPEDAAAWALDAEPVAGIDMAAHAPACPACREAIAQVTPARGVGAGLRRPPAAAAARAADRALSRVRVESGLRALLGTVAGAFLRVARAVPDHVAGVESPRRHPPPDGEASPAVGQPPSDA